MILAVNSINKNFGDKQVLKNISFTAKSGQALGLLGRNGAGKTTTIRIIMSIFLQDSGEVLIDGVPNNRSKVKIGYMPEERGLYPKKNILEQIIYLGELRGLKAAEAKKRAKELLERLEATEYLDKKLETLSKGNQQKIQLAISLINDPDIIILDEPFSGLDPVNAKLLKHMVESLAGEQKIVLFSSHQMSYVEEFCQHICIMNNGRIALDGDLAGIKRSYPRNKILITPEANPAEFIKRLKNETQTAGLISDIQVQGDGCIVILKDQQDKPKLLQSINNYGFSLDKFVVMEPTLEEIFIEKAGALDA